MDLSQLMAARFLKGATQALSLILPKYPEYNFELLSGIDIQVLIKNDNQHNSLSKIIYSGYA